MIDRMKRTTGLSVNVDIHPIHNLKRVLDVGWDHGGSADGRKSDRGQIRFD
jgi:hypothetical protein